MRELLFYSEKVGPDDVRMLLKNLTSRSVPILGVIDPSYFYSKIPSSILIQKDGSTLRFYVKESRTMRGLSNLLFPFKLGEVKYVERVKSRAFPPPKIYAASGDNLLNFMIKEDIRELSFFVRRVLGKFVGTVRAVDSAGRLRYALISNPEKFFEISLEKHPSVYLEVLEPIPKSIAVSSSAPLFQDGDTKIGMDSYDPLQHSLIVGESGSGKTKALWMMVKALEKRYGEKVRIVVLDPHGEFSKKMPEYKSIDFKGSYVEPLDIGAEKSPLMTQLITQLISSTIGENNKYSERILFYSTYLLSSIDRLTLKDINMLLTDSAYRMEATSKSKVDEARRFFDQEYQDIYIHHFNDAVLPILNFIGEYELYLGKDLKKESLLEISEKNNVTIVSFDPNFFGKKMINFLAGAIISQMYILAITEKFKTPTILVIDEFPRVETLVAKDILAETRKFNLYLYLSMQYLGQLRKEIVDAIVSNTRNVVSFKTNRGDAVLVSSIMEIKMEEYFKKSRTATELEEAKREMFVRLNQRECVVRLYDGKKYMLPMRVRTVDVDKWMDPKAARQAVEVSVPVEETPAKIPGAPAVTVVPAGIDLTSAAPDSGFFERKDGMEKLAEMGEKKQETIDETRIVSIGEEEKPKETKWPKVRLAKKAKRKRG
ncbi:Type IV secretion-system coupling protein DNA-binding domain protein [Candidatus Gugararchaeum adminiculabundum]|nr:Type IV secretion-system coupling protein DNA-binding domain protein [Candidatus Gugararchaeum adminiculabundum]